MDGPGSVYEHPDGGMVDLLQHIENYGSLWRWYAHWQLLPDPTLGAIDNGKAARA